MVRSRSVYATFQEKGVTLRKKTLGVVEVNKSYRALWWFRWLG